MYHSVYPQPGSAAPCSRTRTTAPHMERARLRSRLPFLGDRSNAVASPPGPPNHPASGRGSGGQSGPEGSAAFCWTPARNLSAKSSPAANRAADLVRFLTGPAGSLSWYLEATCGTHPSPRTRCMIHWHSLPAVIATDCRARKEGSRSRSGSCPRTVRPPAQARKHTGPSTLLSVVAVRCPLIHRPPPTFLLSLFCPPVFIYISAPKGPLAVFGGPP